MFKLIFKRPYLYLLIVLDRAMALNMAMFEQNGRSGYVLKPAVMWDKSHMMYNHFNPWDKEFDGLHATQLTLRVSTPELSVELYSQIIACNFL